MTPGLPPEAHRLDPDHHPTPFSADQIREACAPGRSNVYRIDPSEGPSHLYAWWFTDGDEEGATIVAENRDLAGTPISEQTTARASWLDLQRHARFPIATTTVATDQVETPAGSFDCWCYLTRGNDAVTRTWFARDLPGPPVLQVTDGPASRRMELVAVVDPRSGA